MKTGTIMLTTEKIIIPLTEFVKKRQNAGYLGIDRSDYGGRDWNPGCV